MNTVIPKRVSNGLRLDLRGDPPLRRLKADQGGIFFWDKRSIVLEDLGGFLAKVEDHGEYVVFSKLNGSYEVASKSVALNGKKLRREVHDGLSAAIQRFMSRLEQADLDVDARRLIDAFKLPNPVQLPEFYRLYRDANGDEQLLILWGCDRSEEDSVPPADIPLLLGRRSFLIDWFIKNKKAVMAAVAAAVILLLVLLYLAWPRPMISANKLELTVGEGCVLTFPEAQGRDFTLKSEGGILKTPSELWVSNEKQLIKAELSNSPTPVTRPDLGRIECQFSTPGEKLVKFESSARFLGIELPKRTSEIWISVKDIASPEDMPSNFIEQEHDLTVQLNSPPGVFPAVVEFNSPMNGEISFGNGGSGSIVAGQPMLFNGYDKPGNYKVSVVDPLKGKERVKYLQLPTGDGPAGLVPNLRLSKDKVKTGERLVVDTSSSYHGDPGKSIVSRRLSLDGGENFQNMEGPYAVVPASKPGNMEVVLEIEDDSGDTRRDSVTVSVEEGETPPLTSIGDLQEGSPLSPTLKGVEIPNDVLFEKGKAELSSKGAEALRDFAVKIAESQRTILIVGHTDDLPITGELQKRFPDNRALSVARAKAAAGLMLSNGVLEDNIQIEGKGATDPVSPGKSEQERALNRRIEILFID